MYNDHFPLGFDVAFVGGDVDTCYNHRMKHA